MDDYLNTFLGRLPILLHLVVLLVFYLVFCFDILIVISFSFPFYMYPVGCYASNLGEVAACRDMLCIPAALYHGHQSSVLLPLFGLYGLFYES